MRLPGCSGKCRALSRGLSEILSFAQVRFPMSIAVLFPGGLTLGSLVLFVLGAHLGLGPGEMEKG